MVMTMLITATWCNPNFVRKKHQTPKATRSPNTGLRYLNFSFAVSNHLSSRSLTHCIQQYCPRYAGHICRPHGGSGTCRVFCNNTVHFGAALLHTKKEWNEGEGENSTLPLSRDSSRQPCPR